MTQSRSVELRCACSAVIGVAVSSAHPLGIALAVTMPALVLRAPSRRASYMAALSYYAAALWPLVPGARNFFGPDVSALLSIALWAIAAAALGSPWPLLWIRYDSTHSGTSRSTQWLWRSPAALFLTVLPPLGIIGWASPLTASGFLFPGTAWCGLATCALLSGALAAWPRAATGATVVIALCANLVYSSDPRPLADWQGVNTHFGAIAHALATPLAEYQAAEHIQQAAISSGAKVLVFPESVVPAWTAATDTFWQPTLDRLRASGKTVLIGARVPITSSPIPGTATFDFSADLSALQGLTPIRILPDQFSRNRLGAHRFPAYRNVVMIRGADEDTFEQRIPVPVAMWNPLRSAGPEINLFGPRVVNVKGERAAILICYEQLVVWPVLMSMIEHPSILVAVANDHWATNTTIPQFQESAVRAWSRLFRVPYVSAVNT